VKTGIGSSFSSSSGESIGNFAPITDAAFAAFEETASTLRET